MSIVRRIFSVLTPIIVLSTAVFVMMNRQQIIDEITLWQYKPSAEIVAIADRVKMSDTGRKMFYVSNPQINRRMNLTKIVGVWKRETQFWVVTIRRLEIFISTT